MVSTDNFIEQFHFSARTPLILTQVIRGLPLSLEGNVDTVRQIIT
jgi:hypothetical protein